MQLEVGSSQPFGLKFGLYWLACSARAASWKVLVLIERSWRRCIYSRVWVGDWISKNASEGESRQHGGEVSAVHLDL